MAHLQSSVSYHNPRRYSGSALGFSAIAMTVVLWASWVVSTKIGVEQSLSAFDLALLRYGIPALFFSYITYKERAQLLSIKPWMLVCICCGAGFPFLYFVAWGMEYAPASHAGILVPGTFPLFVSIITCIRSKKSMSAHYLLGVACILSGIALLIAPAVLASDGWRMLQGHLLFLVGGLLWSLYTVAVQESRISPFAAAGLFSLFSCVAIFILNILGVLESSIDLLSPSFDLDNYIMLGVVQGFFVGVVASFLYMFAVISLGAAKTTAFGALTPVVVVVLSFVLLGEPINLLMCMAVIVVCIGVAITHF